MKSKEVLIKEYKGLFHDPQGQIGLEVMIDIRDTFVRIANVLDDIHERGSETTVGYLYIKDISKK